MGHVAAGFGAGFAGLGAIVAMLHAVLGAFRAADIADLRAQGADPGREFRAARHLASGEGADFGATSIKLDAARHHVDVGLRETGGGAAFAGFDATVADLDAGVKGEVVHGGRRGARRFCHGQGAVAIGGAVHARLGPKLRRDGGDHSGLGT